jgi:hypothetical protein
MAFYFPPHNYRGVIIIQQDDGTYMAYRIIPDTWTVEPQYVDSWDSREIRQVSTRFILDGELLDGFIWKPGSDLFTNQGEIGTQPPAISDREDG